MTKPKVLLIGGYGFLGSNVLKWIDDNNKYIEVVVLSSLNSKGNHFGFKCVVGEYFGDFGDYEFLSNILLANKFDYIFHCLTTSTPINSNESVINDINTNLIYTIKLLELIKESDSILIFFSSGGAIYGNSKSLIRSVNDLPNPISSYGVIKYSIENYIRMFNYIYGLKYLILRISNPYGFFHNSQTQGIINVAISKSLNGQTLEVWGNGENLKDYIFAQDIPPIIFSLLENVRLNSTFNLGSGTGTSINSIIEIINEIQPGLSIVYKGVKSHDVSQFILDVDYSDLYFDFTDLKSGIIETFSWCKGQKNNTYLK
jgi:UDP-glucose 4-epimerase